MCRFCPQTFRSCDLLTSQNIFVFFTLLMCKIALHYFYEFYGFLAIQTHTVVVGYDIIYTGMGIIYFRGKCYPPNVGNYPHGVISQQTTK
jgi:hypothetical protein